MLRTYQRRRVNGGEKRPKEKRKQKASEHKTTGEEANFVNTRKLINQMMASAVGCRERSPHI
jgi:hypothetical protein